MRSPSGRTKRFDRQVTVQDWLVVSIGDSVASGEGNPDHPGKLLPGKSFRARWESSRCHRSAKAGPARAALELEAADPQTTTTFVHLACSGAEIGEGLLDPYEGIDIDRFTQPPLLPPQVDELERIAGERQVDAVLLSIGANDVYFGPIVKFCLKKKRCMRKVFRPPAGAPGSPAPAAGPLEQVVPQAMKRLASGYEQLARRLSVGRPGSVVSPRHVIVADYFDPTRRSDGEFCKRIGFFNPLRWGQIDREEAAWAANDLLRPLNATLSTAASKAGWTEVRGIAEAFATHGYCADESWIVHITRSVFTQKGMTLKSLFAGGFHPNEAGHLREGEMIGRALSEVLGGGANAQSDTTVVTVESRRGSEADGEGDTERTGGIALGGVGAALAAAALLATQRRRKLDDLASGWDGPEGDQLPWGLPPGDAPALTAESVVAYGELVENQAEWVHRRVESIEIVDERIVRRRVSVDFTPGALPGIPPPSFAPIALLSKQVLSRFDLRDEAGQSLPLATSEQNATFAAEHMLRVAEEESGEKPSARLRQLCWQVARGEPDEAWAAVEEIAFRLEPEGVREALRKSKRFRAAATTFASNFAVMVEIDNPLRRRVVKFAYDQRVIQKLTRRQRLGLDPISIGIELPELGDAGSRHFEFVRSEGLEYWSDRLYALQADGSVLRRTAGRMTGDAHLDIGGMPRGTPAFARVFLRATRSRILRTGPALAFISAAVLTCAWFALPDLAGDSGNEAASILLALPAAFGAFLGSRHSHPLEGAMLTGARILVFLAGALAFAGAAALAMTSSVEVLRIVLGAVTLLSWAVFSALVVASRLPRPPSAT